MTLEPIRASVRRSVDASGVVRESAIPDAFILYGSIAEVVSISERTIELLSGTIVRVSAFDGPVPAVGDRVIALRIARYWVALTGFVEV